MADAALFKIDKHSRDTFGAGDVLCPIVIGRDEELAVVNGAMRDALRPHGSVVPFTGEPARSPRPR